MKTVRVLALVLAMSLNTGCTTWTTIEPGNVGIRVNLYGDQKGVEKEVLGIGRYWYSPMATRIIEYPAYVINYKYTASTSEGRQQNEEITFTTRDPGIAVSADVNISYRLSSDHVVPFYERFRFNDMEEFTHGFLRDTVRNGFNVVGGKYAAVEINGPQKDKLIQEVKGYVQDQLKSHGIVVEAFGIIGPPRLPQQITDTLAARMQATQKAIQTENEVRQVQAEARKKVVEAQAEASAQLAKSTGVSKGKVLEAEANAKAARLMAASANSQSIAMKKLEVQRIMAERWDGHIPMSLGGGRSVIYMNPKDFLLPMTAPQVNEAQEQQAEQK